MKVYYPQDSTLQVHQSRVCSCPTGFPAGFYWYGRKRRGPGHPPKWVDRLLHSGPEQRRLASSAQPVEEVDTQNMGCVADAPGGGLEEDGPDWTASEVDAPVADLQLREPEGAQTPVQSASPEGFQPGADELFVPSPGPAMLSETSEALGDKTAENGELATHQSPRAALGRDEDSIVATEEPICDSDTSSLPPP